MRKDPNVCRNERWGDRPHHDRRRLKVCQHNTHTQAILSTTLRSVVVNLPIFETHLDMKNEGRLLTPNAGYSKFTIGVTVQCQKIQGDESEGSFPH
jgi:hypothetical protein